MVNHGGTESTEVSKEFTEVPRQKRFAHGEQR